MNLRQTRVVTLLVCSLVLFCLLANPSSPQIHLHTTSALDRLDLLVGVNSPSVVLNGNRRLVDIDTSMVIRTLCIT